MELRYCEMLTREQAWTLQVCPAHTQTPAQATWARCETKEDDMPTASANHFWRWPQH